MIRRKQKSTRFTVIKSLPAICIHFLVIVGLALLSSGLAFAQATTGTITGVVTDSTGAVIPNANVTIQDLDRGASVDTTTNDQGLFTRTQLANGRYSVNVAAQGFKGSKQNNIIVNVDRETRIDVTLQPGEAQES